MEVFRTLHEKKNEQGEDEKKDGRGKIENKIRADIKSKKKTGIKEKDLIKD